MASEAARSLYASLNKEDDLLCLVSDKTKEGLYIEFKMKKNRLNGGLDDSDKWQFSRALSGFANSDGGVLIWGIETNTHEEACDLKPIADVQKFFSALKKSILNTTQPVVDGVLLEVIETAENSNSGYVKCLVPTSDKTPHRAMVAEREYYKRTTEGFYKLEHFDLEDMFGRRPHPSLAIYMELRPRSGSDPRDELHFGLINNGRGVAKHSGFFCTFEENVRIEKVNGHGLNNASALNNGRPFVSFADDVSVIHPTGINTVVGHAVIARADRGKNVKAKVTWYCEGMAMRSADVEVAPKPIS